MSYEQMRDAMTAAMPPSPNSPPVLTSAVMEAWLVSGVPPASEIEDAYGLGHDWFDLKRDDLSHSMLSGLSRGCDVIPKIGFAIPCREAIELLVRSGPLIEVGAGTGFWAALVTRAGGDIIATDANEGSHLGYGFEIGRFHPVKTMAGKEAVIAHPDRNVLAVWPTGWSSWMAEMIPHVHGKLHFVAEGVETSADEAFYRYLNEHFVEVDDDYVAIPRWTHMHDQMRTLERRR